MRTDAPAHRLVGFCAALDTALDKVGDVEPTFMSASEKRAALVGLRRAQDRLAALTMRLLCAAEDVAETTGARDAAAWLAVETRTERVPNLADQRLGAELDRQWVQLGAALATGQVNLAQTRVIAHALGALPVDLEVDLRARAETQLIALAAHHRPSELVVLGRRILDVVAPDLAEGEEARRLEEEEQRARETMTFHAKRLGDGSTRIVLKVPDASADRLRTYLDAFTSPRHDGPGAASDVAGWREGDRIPARRAQGQAFCALLEALDPARLPEHGGHATNVIVTVALDALREQLATAGVITSDNGAISASEARRLACTATLIPAVLGAQGEVLELGRGSRLFNKAQRRALRLRDRRCRADGCTVPAGWCEAHHWDPWSGGGRTDLDNGLLLCSWHHHRAHDDRYLHQRMPNGDVRFARRP